MDSLIGLTQSTAMRKVFVIVVFAIIIQFVWFFVNVLDLNANVGYITFGILFPMVLNIIILGI
jgi:hypothetical protein